MNISTWIRRVISLTLVIMLVFTTPLSVIADSSDGMGPDSQQTEGTSSAEIKEESNGDTTPPADGPADSSAAQEGPSADEQKKDDAPEGASADKQEVTDAPEGTSADKQVETDTPEGTSADKPEVTDAPEGTSADKPEGTDADSGVDSDTQTKQESNTEPAQEPDLKMDTSSNQITAPADDPSIEKKSDTEVQPVIENAAKAIPFASDSDLGIPQISTAQFTLNSITVQEGNSFTSSRWNIGMNVKCRHCGYLNSRTYRVQDISDITYAVSPEGAIVSPNVTLKSNSYDTTWFYITGEAVTPGNATVTVSFSYNFGVDYDVFYCNHCGQKVTVQDNIDRSGGQITLPVTITANQNSTLYKLSYNANGGTGAPADQTETTTATEQSFTVSSTVPTRDGFTFLGWADSPDATSASYNGGDSITLQSSAPTKTLYAVWEKNSEQEKFTYTLTYDANDGTGAPADQTVTTTATEQPFTVSSTVPTRDGFTFLGWADSPDATSASYNGGDSITLQSSAPTKTLYAVWKQNVQTYKVTFTDGVDGEEIFADKTVTVAQGQSASFGDVPTRNGYDFAGWSLSPATADLDNVLSDITATATWTRNLPNPPTDEWLQAATNGVGITVRCTNDQVNHAPKSYGLIPNSYEIGKVEWNGDIASCSITVQRAPYVSKFSEETGVTHASSATDGTTITLTLTWTGGSWHGSSATIKVVCETPKPQYTVTFDAVDGWLGTAHKMEFTVSEGDPFPTVPNEPKLDGYEFKGWSVGTQMVEVFPETVTSNLTYTAIWEKTVYTIHVTFEGVATNDGEVSSDDLSKTLNPVDATAPEGQRFIGWCLNYASEDTLYTGTYDFESLEPLVKGNWTNGFNGYLYFYPLFEDIEEPVYTIHVAFEGVATNDGEVSSDDLSKTLNPVDATAPEGQRFVGWCLNYVSEDTLYTGTYDFESLEPLVKGNWTNDFNGYLYFYPLFEDIEEPVYTIHVAFEGVATNNGDVSSSDPNAALNVSDATAPEGQVFVGWCLNYASEDTLYTGTYDFESLEPLVKGNWTNDFNGYLYFYPLFEDIEEPVYTIHVAFEGVATNNGDVSSSDPNAALNVSDATAPEGQRFIGWCLNYASEDTLYTGTYDFESLEPLVKGNWTNDFNGYLYFYPLFEDIEEPVYTIHVTFEGVATNNGDVSSSDPNAALKVSDATAPEGQVFVGWKALVGNQPIYDGAYNFSELSSLVGDSWTPDTHESWLTFVPVFTDISAPKTLKIFWAIDNPDGAEWTATGDGDPWTETIAWNDRENTFVIPALSVKDGYKLNGWSVSGRESNFWDPITSTFGLTGLIVEDDEGGYVAITANIVADSAPVEPEKLLSVKFVANGGSWTDSVPATYDKFFTLSSRTANAELISPDVSAPEGKVFSHWQSRTVSMDALTGFTYNDFAVLTDYDVTVNENGVNEVTFTAVYTDAAPKTLKIFWAIDNPDGAEWTATGDGKPWTETIAWSDRENTFVIPALSVKDGYKLNGWSVSGKESNFWDPITSTFGLTGLIVEDDEGGHVAITANVVVDQPVPETHTYTLHLNPNGGVYGSVKELTVTTEDSSAMFDLSTLNATDKPYRDGYTFAGWALENGASVIRIVLHIDQPEETVYAVWAKNYTITYADGADGAVFADKIVTPVLAGSQQPFDPPAVPDRAGYVLVGWAPTGLTEADLTGESQFRMPENDVLFTAQWADDRNNNHIPDDQEAHYTVVYTDGANGAAFADQLYTDVLTDTATPAFKGTPARAGYTFKGWSPALYATVTGNITYTAVWTKNAETAAGSTGSSSSDVPKTGDSADPVQLALMLGSLLFLSVSLFTGLRYRKLRKQ